MKTKVYPLEEWQHQAKIRIYNPTPYESWYLRVMKGLLWLCSHVRSRTVFLLLGRHFAFLDVDGKTTRVVSLRMLN